MCDCRFRPLRNRSLVHAVPGNLVRHRSDSVIIPLPLSVRGTLSFGPLANALPPMIEPFLGTSPDSSCGPLKTCCPGICPATNEAVARCPVPGPILKPPPTPPQHSPASLRELQTVPSAIEHPSLPHVCLCAQHFPLEY